MNSSLKNPPLTDLPNQIIGFENKFFNDTFDEYFSGPLIEITPFGIIGPFVDESYDYYFATE